MMVLLRTTVVLTLLVLSLGPLAPMPPRAGAAPLTTGGTSKETSAAPTPATGPFVAMTATPRPPTPTPAKVAPTSTSAPKPQATATTAPAPTKPPAAPPTPTAAAAPTKAPAAPPTPTTAPKPLPTATTAPPPAGPQTAGTPESPAAAPAIGPAATATQPAATPVPVIATAVPDVAAPTSAPTAPATIAPTTPPPPAADTGPGVPPPAGPLPAPAQLLPTFARASQLTGVPQEILLAVARIESGFTPRAVGPLIERFADTEDAHALGMMQFLPSTYRMVMPRVDAATGKGLGMAGIWDAESAIYAAAFYLQDSGAPGNLRRAIFAYNNADWYVDLILAWAGHYAGGTIPDASMYDPNREGPGRPIAAPENPQMPVRSHHLDLLSPIPLYAPFASGQVWHSGGDGSFYGGGLHTDQGSAHYAVDFNKGTRQRLEEDEGQPVLAVADGIINNVYATAGGGWTVEMYHRSPEGSLLRSVYLHLRDDPRGSAGIKMNQAVVHGTLIGFVGNTGDTSTGAHLHFALYLVRDGAWVSIRPEPMEGRFLQDGGAIVSSNSPAGRTEFVAAWNATDKAVADGTSRTWLWGPQPFTSGVIESYGAGANTRLVQYYDKGRMERLADGRGSFIITAGRLGWELLTGRVEAEGGHTVNDGPARIPLVGGAKDQGVPTYADAAREAAGRTLDYNGAQVAWQLMRGGKVVPIAPPADVRLVNYDPVTGHNVADVFARWYDETFFHTFGANGDEALGLQSLNAAMASKAKDIDPGHPLTDPFWVEVMVDGAPRMILVQIFERWVLTYTPSNPAGWQIELGNVGRHYYEWQYESELREATVDTPGRLRRRRRTNRTGKRRRA